MPEALLTFATMAETGNFSAEKKLAMLDQRHLRWQVISLKHLHAISAITEANVIRSSVITGPKQPEGVQTTPHNNMQSGDFNLLP